MRDAGLILSVLVGCVAFGCWIDEAHWSWFKAKHHCTNAGQEWKTGHPNFTVDYHGNLVPTYSSNPARWLYRCDAGQLVWRDN